MSDAIPDLEVLKRNLKYRPRIWDTVPAFALKDWGKTRKSSVTIAGIPAEIRAWNLPISVTALSSSAGSIDSVQLSILVRNQSVSQTITLSFNKCMVGRTGSCLYSPVTHSHIVHEMEFMLPVTKTHWSVRGAYQKRPLPSDSRTRNLLPRSSSVLRIATQIRRHVLSEVRAYSTSREPKISITADIYLNRIKRTPYLLAKKSDVKTDGNENQTEAVTIFGQKVQFYTFLTFLLTSAALIHI